MNTYKCRLCDGSLTKKFKLTILRKHNAEYYECNNCGSLQTEPPHWLDEAYGNKHLANTDTGAAQRSMNNLAACYAISKLFKAKNAIDIGGGDGLLCRLLRDYDINCFVKDKYATPTYAQGFTEQNFSKPDLVIGFEVLEHFPTPKSDLEILFKHNSNVLLLSTAIYTNEKSDWWYLAPGDGQHVFFYSKKALELIAKKYKYTLIVSGGFILFVRESSAFRMAVARILLNRIICRLIRALVALLPARGVWKDHSLKIEKPI